MPRTLVSTTEAARDFLVKSGYLFPQLEKVDFDQSKQQWALTFNVGIGQPKLKKVVVDETSGQVVAFE
jgi:hypothetical protein